MSIVIRDCSLPATFTIPEDATGASFINVVFVTWPVIPATLRRLAVDGCSTEDGSPMTLPASGLTDLAIGYQPLRPVSFPVSLTTLRIRKMVFDSDLLSVLPPALESLRLIRVCASAWPSAWPDSLSTIFISGGNWATLPVAWPAALTTLKLDECVIVSMPPVPSIIGSWQGEDLELCFDEKERQS